MWIQPVCLHCCVAKESTGRNLACLADKTRYISLWTNMQSPFCTSHIMANTFLKRIQAHDCYVTFKKCYWSVSNQKKIIFKYILACVFLNFCNEQWVGMKSTWTGVLIFQSQPVTSTETEHNPVDYWHCRETLVLFHSVKIIHSKGLITMFPQCTQQ